MIRANRSAEQSEVERPRIRHSRTIAAHQLSIGMRKLDYLRTQGKIIGRVDKAAS